MVFEIVNDRLEIGGRPASFVAANSFGSRFHPTLIVVHDTADRPVPKDTVAWFADKSCKVSAHFVVERNGSVTQMVDCDRKAFHAGQSFWPGMKGAATTSPSASRSTIPGNWTRPARLGSTKMVNPGLRGSSTSRPRSTATAVGCLIRPSRSPRSPTCAVPLSHTTPPSRRSVPTGSYRQGERSTPILSFRWRSCAPRSSRKRGSGTASGLSQTSARGSERRGTRRASKAEGSRLSDR